MKVNSRLEPSYARNIQSAPNSEKMNIKTCRWWQLLMHALQHISVSLTYSSTSSKYFCPFAEKHAVPALNFLYDSIINIMLILLCLPAYISLHKEITCSTRHKPVMQALWQDQVLKALEWWLNSDDVCLARKQGQCHRTAHSGWFPLCSDQVQYPTQMQCWIFRFDDNSHLLN